MNFSAYLPLFGIAAALLFFGLGLWDYQRTQALIRQGQRTAGTYVGAVAKTTIDTSTAEYNVVEFQTQAGQIVQFEARTGLPGRQRAIGKPVAVLYDPAAPEAARIVSFVELWLATIIFLGMGVGLLLATLILWLLL